LSASAADEQLWLRARASQTSYGPVTAHEPAKSICGPVLLPHNHRGDSLIIDSSLAGTLTSSR
jgi:hypothetical protein